MDQKNNSKDETLERLEEKIHALNSKGKIRAAIKSCQKYLEIDQANAYIYRLTGKLQFKIGNPKGAIENLKMAVNVKPDFPDAYYNMGICYYHQIQFNKAIDSLNKCLEYDPDFNMAYYWLGLTYYHLGESQQAINACKTLLKKHSSSLVAHYHLGTKYN